MMKSHASQAPAPRAAAFRRAALIGAAALAAAGAGAGEVLVAHLDGAIGPVSARFMNRAIARGEQRNAACVIFELDTPGGLDEAMRAVVKTILAARTPVVVYVAPAGSRAASAGVFITLAAHVAAMAPGTAIGAAHPVALGGAPGDSNLTAKAANDAAALLRSLAETRGRNIAWANSAVHESVSLSETEALQANVIDLVAPSLAALLEALDGRAVQLGAAERRLATRGATITRLGMNWRDDILAAIANPNLAYILLMLGLLGLYFEFSNPGAILPGVVGGIALILAFFALQTLSVNFAGILLILLAIVLFITDVASGSLGILSIGGVVAMFIGSLMLFDSPDPALRVSLPVLIPVAAVTAAFFLLGAWLSIRSLTRRSVSGATALLDREAETLTPVDGRRGQVFVDGAIWQATAASPLPAGARVRVIAVKNLTLEVQALP